MGCEAIANGSGVPLFMMELSEHVRRDYLNADIRPQPLPGCLTSVMAWRDDLLPELLRAYVRDVAERTQCPPDFVAVALVVACSAVVGRKFIIHPKAHDDWSVVLNQWGALIGRPSAMKTPALKQALRPLAGLQERAMSAYRDALTEHAALGEIIELQRQFARENAKKMVREGKSDSALAEINRVPDSSARPTLRRYIVNDASVEKLGELLNENPNGLLLVRDELGGWLATMQTEDGAVGRAFYLECFDGNNSFVYDRIGRGTLFIQSCCLSLIGGIQPSRIAPLIRGAITGASDDGLVQRLQLAVWPDDNREWRLVDRWPDSLAAEAVESLMNELDQMPDGPQSALRFSPNAQQAFNEWYQAHMLETKSAELHPALESHFMKMPQTIAGLALLFELIDGGRSAVGIKATVRAVEWAAYLKTHAGRMYGAAINAPLIGAQLILSRRDKLPEPFTPREIRSKKWMGLDTTEAVNDALAVLQEHKIVIGYEVGSEAGGRPSRRFIWRPIAS